MIQQFHSWEYMWRKQNTMSKRYLYINVHCNIIFNSQDMETTYGSADGWTSQKNVKCIYSGIQFCHEKERKSTICNNMDRLKGLMLSEINQTEQDKL